LRDNFELVPYILFCFISCNGENFENLYYRNFSEEILIEFCNIVPLITLSLGSCWVHNSICARQAAIIRWFSIGSKIISFTLCCPKFIIFLSLFVQSLYWMVYCHKFWSQWASDEDQESYYFRQFELWCGLRSSLS
jgi:hypothetical protein